MIAEKIYNAWAPEASIWSKWAKPVLFAHMSTLVIAQSQNAPAASMSEFASLPPEAEGSTTIVVDLPGVQSVDFGIACASRGYLPVPLFNSVPSPTGTAALFIGPTLAVDMSEIVNALIHNADRMSALKLPANVPPAFLLDSRRRGGPKILGPSSFDNRSVSLPTDFPSANLLLHHGIKRVITVQQQFGQPQSDLAHTLRRWQQAGIEILACDPSTSSALAAIVISRPPWFRHFWYGLLARFGLRRNPLGGFGGFIPELGSAG